MTETKTKPTIVEVETGNHTMTAYNAAAFRDRGICCPEVRGLIAGVDDIYAAQYATESVRLAADPRIPASATGYVHQLLSPSCSPAVRRDAIAQLSRYVDFSNVEIDGE